MSSQPGRKGVKRLIGGVVLGVLGVIAHVTVALHDTRYIPICVPGSHWIHAGGCRILELRLIATIGVIVLGALLALRGGAVQIRGRRQGLPGVSG